MKYLNSVIVLLKKDRLRYAFVQAINWCLVNVHHCMA